MKNNILIVTEQYFPSGSAMAGRIISFCKIFLEKGHNIHVISLHSTEKNIEINKTKIYEGIEYEVLSNKERTSLETFIGNDNFIKKIEKYITNNEVDVVFAVSVHIKYVDLYNLCRKNNIPLIVEQCEWYDPSSYKFNIFDPRYIRFSKNIKNNYIKANGVISISRLLNDYFISKETKSIRIPSIFDVKNIKFYNNKPSDKIKLIYSGNTSKSKDLILPIIEALSSKEEYKNKIQFDIYGMNKDQLMNNIGDKNNILNELSESVFAHGYVPREEFEDALGNADYQIFIKPYRRSSNACFPTKLAESMSYGTPVIANNTGDISLFLQDGENGYICEGCTSNHINEVFDKVISLNRNKYMLMRENARKTAEKHFDYRNYISDIDDFINNI